MGNFLSSSHKPKKAGAANAAAQITEQDMVLLSLKTQRNKLNKQQSLLAVRIDRHQEVARELLREGRRDRALVALKKKKMTEKQLEQLATHSLNLEAMLNNIESMKHQAKALEVLQRGNEQLKALQQLVSLDDVKQLMEDTADAKAYRDELNQLLEQSLSPVDNEAVAAEMEAMEEEQLQEQVASMPTAPLPTPEQEAVKASQQRAAAEKAAASLRAEAEEAEAQAAASRREKLGPMLAS